MHHQIVVFLGVLGPSFLLVIGIIAFLLPLCCLNEGGCVGWVIGELNLRFFELVDCKHGEGSIVFQGVCEVLGDSFNVQVEDGHCFGGPCVVKYDVFKTLRGCYECGFLWGEVAMGEMLLPSFDFWFFFCLCHGRRLKGSHPIIVGSQSDGMGSMVCDFY
jgi:hypothetical protein